VKNEPASPVDPRLDEISSSLFRVAVKAVIRRDGKFLLVKETEDDWWGLPGGGIRHGESPQQALTRELEEELGLPASALEIDPQVIFTTTDGVVRGIPKTNLFYRVRLPGGQTEFTPTPDVEQSGWFTPKELTTLYMSPSGGRGLVDFLSTSHTRD
jgi:8-oxo-dGTP pyrophosphatase MutT (NUDIX family)